MGSPNRNSKKGMRRDKTCKYCGKSYAMDWAKNNHQRSHGERLKDEYIG